MDFSFLVMLLINIIYQLFSRCHVANGHHEIIIVYTANADPMTMTSDYNPNLMGWHTDYQTMDGSTSLLSTGRFFYHSRKYPARF